MHDRKIDAKHSHLTVELQKFLFIHYFLKCISSNGRIHLKDKMRGNSKVLVVG
jgi:hypothetical protein